MLKKTLFINGVEKRVVVDPDASLVRVLRNQLFLTGTKNGSGNEECGACTVLLDGKAVRSCGLKMRDVPDDAHIVTIEGIGTKEHLHPLQAAWILHNPKDTGFTAPGFLVSAFALLTANPDPTKTEIEEWFRANRNLSETGDSEGAIAAVLEAARVLRGEETEEELLAKVNPEALSEGIAKVTGALEFAADLGVKLPEGTMYGKLVRASVAQGTINGIDTTEALKVPGVCSVLTAKEIKGTNRIAGKDGSEEQILHDRKIDRTCDAIAMVLAYRPSIAEEAAKKVKLVIEESSAGAPHAKKENLSLEPDVAFAYVDDMGKVIIHSKTKDLDLRALADAVGVPAEKIRVLQNGAAGAYDCAFSPVLEGLAGAAALASGKPVYLEL